MNTDLNYGLVLSDLFQILNKYRHYSSGLVSSCECAHNCERKLLFNDLEQQFKTYFDNNRHFFVNFEYSDLKNNFSKHLMDIMDTNVVNQAIDGIIKSESIEQPLEELIEDNVINDDIICPNLDINDSFHEDCNVNNETQAVTQVINIKKEVNDCNQNECQSLTVKKKRPYVRRKPLKKSAKSVENFHYMSKIIEKFKATENNSTAEDTSISANCEAKKAPKQTRNSSPVYCPHCSRVLKSKFILRKHIMNAHTDDTDKPLKCDECGKGYSQRSHLSQHKLAAHSDGKQIECDDCEFRTTSQKYLINHRRRVHERAKPFVCRVPDCDYKTGTNYELMRHYTLIHFDERPFECPHCHRTMKSKLNLSRHIVCVHSPNKPFKCDECGRGFGQRAYLVKHKLSVHAREKRFKCDKCKYRSSIYTYLAVHQRRRHQR